LRKKGWKRENHDDIGIRFGKVIDLTMRVSQKIKVFPGSPQPAFITWSKLDVHGYDSEVMYMSTHTGTHMDAPSHFASRNVTIDDIPASRLVSEAVLIKVPRKADQLIEVGDISEDVEEHSTVVFVTGWEKEYKRDHYMTKNPGISGKTAEYLVKRNVNAVAIDSPSIDAGFDMKFTAHNVLLRAGILVIENLCNVDKLDKKKFMLVVTPLKLAGASGSPIRALALLS
jgi:arylformamidase